VIDLWVVSETLQFADKIKIFSEIKTFIGDQKIDLTIKNKKESSQDLFYASLEKVELE